MSMSVCVSVCLSAMISPEPHARSLPFLCMLPMAVARSSSGRVTKSQGGGAVFGEGSSPLTMHCNAFAAKGTGQEGGDGSAQREQSVIYDCLLRRGVATAGDTEDALPVRPTISPYIKMTTDSLSSELTFDE